MILCTFDFISILECYTYSKLSKVTLRQPNYSKASEHESSNVLWHISHFTVVKILISRWFTNFKIQGSVVKLTDPKLK